MAKKDFDKESKSKNERAVFDRPVQRQGSPIYKVLSMGVCVEFTDKIMSANAAYKEASKPKQMFKISGKHVEKVYEQVI
jgi:hypothetical protein